MHVALRGPEGMRVDRGFRFGVWALLGLSVSTGDKPIGVSCRVLSATARDKKDGVGVAHARNQN